MPDSLWYKDAVFYELHVKAFQDSNADGVGDFRGLIDRLGYVRDLGVDAIWLLPFYPSPLKDDGYDIADYYGVHPSYGTLEDFERFLAEAHRCGLKVIADLVLNHTSDQHPWFQRARRAPKGSPERNWYVWSDTDELYPEARIIFTDTEPSNWTWDPVAGQYYWHRFFAHQPDLNWDNPEVKEAMFRVMEFWMDKGLDGFRCDAVPYLIEREGTICENLPETHAILKEFRVRMDHRYPDKVLLAEANQWPDDVRPYFGDADEFHMAFHFPLMPRIFMAVRQGIRKPIVEIIERTPPIPESCQWCMFLRNHDELTLEMVTDEERDYMYQEYAQDPRMRLNLGIRRRLAPLMDNDRRKIELLNSILLTMPGSPILYYGDEMGMGDNIWLGDRDGVRTPMQWSPDRNAGFSRAEPARLYLPVINDSVYGYQAINVEAQQKSPFSLLNSTKRLIQVRKQYHAFGRGSIEFLEPANPHVLAYLREHEGDTVLVVNNMSGTAQPVQLDLSRYSGRRPVELLGQTEFLPIDETPYALTLSPYGFFWFVLREARVLGEEVPGAHLPLEWAEQEDALFGSAESVQRLLGAITPEWLRTQRWFRGKAREVLSVEAADFAVITPDGGGPRALLALVRVSYDEGEPELYQLALTLFPPAGQSVEPLLVLAIEGQEVRLYDALIHRYAAEALLSTIEEQRDVATAEGGMLRGRASGALRAATGARYPVRALGAEQSNSSVVFGDAFVLKAFRKLEMGVNPEIELSRYLAEHTGFRAFAPLVGCIEYASAEAVAAVAGLFRFIPNLGDAWSFTLKNLTRYFAAASRSAADPTARSGRDFARRTASEYMAAARAIGTVTAELHLALAAAPPERADLAPAPIDEHDVQRWTAELEAHTDRVLGELARRLEAMPGSFPAEMLGDVAAVVREAAAIRQRMDDLRLLGGAEASKTRIHGDYHLGQLLRAAEPSLAGGEWIVLDLEGEPARPLEERRLKHSPLRDVAGMLRSFNYAVQMTLKEQDATRITGRSRPVDWARLWEREVRAEFLDAYVQRANGAPFLPQQRDVLERVLAVFELDKALYELDYELNNRPDWLWLPLAALKASVEAAP